VDNGTDTMPLWVLVSRDMAGPMCMKVQMVEEQGLIRMENLRAFLNRGNNEKI